VTDRKANTKIDTFCNKTQTDSCLPSRIPNLTIEVPRHPTPKKKKKKEKTSGARGEWRSGASPSCSPTPQAHLKRGQKKKQHKHE